MNGVIRTATKQDLKKVIAWLKLEDKKNGQGFFGNRGLLSDHYKENELFTFTENDKPLGFITGPINGPDILCVREDYQERGIGTMLYEFIQAKAIQERSSLIKVQCKPKKSIKFWRKMGFTIKDEDSGVYGYKVLNYKNILPQGKTCNVTIEAHSEDGGIPIPTIHTKAVKEKSGRFVLEDRIILFKEEGGQEFRDFTASIKVDGQIFYEGVVKYNEAGRLLGVMRLGHQAGYYIDSIGSSLNRI